MTPKSDLLILTAIVLGVVVVTAAPAMADPPEVLLVTVDCNAGGNLAQALREAQVIASAGVSCTGNGSFFGGNCTPVGERALRMEVSGTCALADEDYLEITKDKVSIVGVGGARVEGGSPLLRITGAVQARVDNLTISCSSPGDCIEVRSAEMALVGGAVAGSIRAWDSRIGLNTPVSGNAALVAINSVVDILSTLIGSRGPAVVAAAGSRVILRGGEGLSSESGPFAVQVVEGSTFRVTGPHIIDGDVVVGGAELRLEEAVVNGSLTVTNKSYVELEGASVVDVTLSLLSEALITDGVTVRDLVCDTSSEATCLEPLTVGTSNCAACPVAHR